VNPDQRRALKREREVAARALLRQRREGLGQASRREGIPRLNIRKLKLNFLFERG
jgi:hypothetical protein